MLVGSVLLVCSGAVFLIEGLGAVGLVLGSVVLGTGHLFSVVGQQAAVANTAGPGTFDSAFGYYTFAASLGQAAGPAVITLFGGQRAIPDTGLIFAVATGLAVALVACTALLRLPQPGPGRDGGARGRDAHADPPSRAAAGAADQLRRAVGGRHHPRLPAGPGRRPRPGGRLRGHPADRCGRSPR